MNLIQLSEQLKDVPDDFLQREITQPTGAYPSYLVISEMTRRQRMRDKAMKQEPATSVAEDLMGINAIPQAAQSLAGRDVSKMGPPQQPMPPQMPPQMPSQMPPQMPPEMMQQLQMPQPMMAGGGLVAFQNRGLVDLDELYKDELRAELPVSEQLRPEFEGSGFLTIENGVPTFSGQSSNPFTGGTPPVSFDPYAGQGAITQEAQEFPKKEFIESEFRKEHPKASQSIGILLNQLDRLKQDNILKSAKEGVEEGVEGVKGFFGGLKDYFTPMTDEDRAKADELREKQAQETELRKLAKEKQLEREIERQRREPRFGVKEVDTFPVTKVTTDNKDDKLLEQNISKDNKIKSGDTQEEKNQKKNAFNVAKNSLQSSDILNQMEQFKFMTPKEREKERLKGEKEFEKKYTNPLSFLQNEIKAEEKRIKKLDFDNMNNALIMAGAAVLQSPGGRDLKWLGTGLQGFQNAYTQGRRDILDAKKSLLESRISLAKSENDFAMNKENAGLKALEMAEKSNDRFNNLIDTKFANWVKQVELTQKEREIGIKEQYYRAQSQLDYVDPDDVQKIRTQLLLQFEDFDKLSPAEQDVLIEKEAIKMGKRYVPSVSLPSVDPGKAGTFNKEDFDKS